MDLDVVDEEYETKMVGFESDCNDGNGVPQACHHVGEFFSVVKDDHLRAAKVYSDNCYGKKYGPSCFNLGRFHLSGRGVPQDDKKAEELFDKACTAGHRMACYHQGLLMFLNARGDATDAAPKDKKLQLKAIKLLELNCQKGDHESCQTVGSYLINPALPERERDPAKAEKYFKSACENNHTTACFNLAVMYKKGDKGVVADSEKFAMYEERTKILVKQYGGLGGRKLA